MPSKHKLDNISLIENVNPEVLGIHIFI